MIIPFVWLSASYGLFLDAAFYKKYRTFLSSDSHGFNTASEQSHIIQAAQWTLTQLEYLYSVQPFSYFVYLSPDLTRGLNPNRE